ncbi:MAG TPA: tetratricopeptide repeat protein [Planktothrix sp.]
MTSSAFLKLSGNVRIGELLVQSGMLTKAQLLEATRHAGTKRLQIGQILVMYGYVTAKDLQSALTAQSMVRDRLLDLSNAVKGLKVAYKTGARFEDVVNSQEYPNNPSLPTGKLGELLLDAGIISSEQFLKAMDKSMTTGLPLGRTLVLENAVSEDLLSTALDAQVRLRDQMYTRDEAIEQLQIAAGVAPSTEAKSREHPLSQRHGIRLGELLVLGGIVTATDVLNAVEWALVNSKPLGEVLVAHDLVKQETIDTALSLQKMVQERTIDGSQAANCLQKVLSENITLEEAVAKAKAQEAAPVKLSLDYQKLLTLARVVSHDDINSALEMTLQEPRILGRLLVSTGFADDSAIDATLECLEMLASGILSQDDAVVALDYCLHHRGERKITFQEALQELGWQPQTAPKLESRAKQKEAARPQSDETVMAPPIHGINWTIAVDTEDRISLISAAVDAAALPGDGVQQVFDLDFQESLAPQPEEPITLPGGSPSVPSPAGRKGRKFTETLAPEDPRAREFASVINQMKSGSGGLLERLSKGDLCNIMFDSYIRLAESYIENGNYQNAQLVYERILVLRLQELGPNNVSLVGDYRNLAAILCTQERFDKAEPFLRRAVTILEAANDQELNLAELLTFLANIYLRQAKHAECEPLLNQALKIREQALPSDHMEIADTLFDLARLCRKTNRLEDSERMYLRAKEILAKNQSRETAD